MQARGECRQQGRKRRRGRLKKLKHDWNVLAPEVVDEFMDNTVDRDFESAAPMVQQALVRGQVWMH